MEYQKNYIKKYFELEFRTHRWVQLTPEECGAIEELDDMFNRKNGYKFEKNGLTFSEFHVDDHPSFHEKMAAVQHGGNLSIRNKMMSDRSL